MSLDNSNPVALDRHLSVAEIARQWGVSCDTVRRHFEHVPGVLRLGHAETKAKRRYTTVRVPERIVRAQHALLTKRGRNAAENCAGVRLYVGIPKRRPRSVV
jgi:hypothetical protein